MKMFLLVIAAAITPTAATAATIDLQAMKTGWYAEAGPNPTRHANYFTGDLGSEHRSFFAFSLEHVNGQIPPGHMIASATLLIQNPTSFSPEGVETLGLFQVLTLLAQINSGVNFSTTYDDLGTGPSYGEFDVITNGVPPLLTLTLKPGAVDDLRQTIPQAFTGINLPILA